MKQLILGGVKSGKSRWAEQQATASGRTVFYIATAKILDSAMQLRIEAHRARRPGHWELVEAPYELAASIAEYARDDRCLLIDCLTLWLTQLLCLEDELYFQQQRERLLEELARCPGDILLVSNEVGLGIIADNVLARRFTDEAGSLHQELATLCDRVTLVTAGLPHHLKDS